MHIISSHKGKSFSLVSSGLNKSTRKIIGIIGIEITVINEIIIINIKRGNAEPKAVELKANTIA